MKELKLEARTDNISAVTLFADELLEEAGCPMKTQLQIDVAIDEVMANISNYAYGGQPGEVTVRMETEDRTAVLTFIDRGMPFNPLDQPPPDVSLPAEKRGIGGLGIFLVRKTMDEVIYERRGDTNVLTLRKHFA